MKKVLLVFFGAVVLTQAILLWQRDHGASAANRAFPAGGHPRHSAPGPNKHSSPAIMIT